MPMREYLSIVGIDPSLTATAVCANNRKSVAVEVHSSKPAKTMAGRIERYETLTRDVATSFDDLPLPLIVLEGYSYASANKAVPLGEYGSILRVVLLRMGRVIEVTPSSLKQFATGKGNANKCAMVASLTKRYGVEFKTDDEYDAFALMKLGECLAGWSEAQTAIQQKVVNDIMKAEGL